MHGPQDKGNVRSQQELWKPALEQVAAQFKKK
jgi:hypothetical protein